VFIIEKNNLIGKVILKDEIVTIVNKGTARTATIHASNNVIFQGLQTLINSQLILDKPADEMKFLKDYLNNLGWKIY
jgi:hypothetical protein